MRQLHSFVAKHQLLRPGDRVTIAVSGGCDSVGLLRLLLDARSQLGIVLSVAHFNHKLRGSESDQDEHFVRELAATFDLPIYVSEADTAQFAREKELSIEAAARELRYSAFSKVIAEGHADKIATAHTLDDQAETVLLRTFRGTGTSGLSGIHPRLIVGSNTADWKGIIRPLLSIHRGDIEQYLRERNQPWRTDSTNSETVFTRNRLRHDLLPLIKKNFNPEIVTALSNLADIARVEDEFWSAQTAAAFVRVHRNQAIDVPELLQLHPALQRRVLRLAAIQAGATLDFHHSEHILEHLGKNRGQIELPNGFVASIDEKNVSFQSNHPQPKPCGYSYRLTIPGEVELAELGIGVRTVVVNEIQADDNNDVSGLVFQRLPAELVVRSWRPGDRFWPAHTSSPKKVKELLQERHLSARTKSLWPVALAGSEIVWMRGFPVAHPYVARQGKAVLIQEFPLHVERI